MKHEHIVKCVEPGSIAEELELEPGDELISINGQIIEDVFDYHYLVNDDYLEIVIRKSNQEEWELEIEKDVVRKSPSSGMSALFSQQIPYNLNPPSNRKPLLISCEKKAIWNLRDRKCRFTGDQNLPCSVYHKDTKNTGGNLL